MKNKPKIVFFGTPKFAKIILEKLIQSGYKPELVVTTEDKPVGRKQKLTPSSVKSLTMKHKTWNIQILQPEKLDEEFISQIKKNKPDLFIVSAYGKLLPKELLDIPKYGALNIHPSMLPKWRGPSPIQSAILNGEKTTGTTIMLMDEKMDHGPILTQRELKISKNDTSETLHEKLAKQGAQLLVETINNWLIEKIEPKQQKHNKASYTKIITREDGRIDWQKSAEEIENMLRAFTPWPGIFTYLNQKRLKILSMSIEKDIQINEPGNIISYKSSFAIETKKGIIIPKEIQLEGKLPQKANHFLDTYSEIIGKKL